MEKSEKIYVRNEDMSYAYEPGVETVEYVRADVVAKEIKALKERIKALEDDNVQGAASAQNAGLNLGQQIEQIASGLDVIKKAGINNADMVAGSIRRVSSALNTFGVNNKKREAGVV